MDKLKDLVKKYFASFAFFYRYLRYRIFIAVGLNILVGVMDGFGLAMFLPMLQMVENANEVNPEGLGRLRFLIDWIENVGIPLNLVSVLSIMFFFFLVKGLIRFISHVYRVTLQQFFMRNVRLNLVNSFNNLSFKAFSASDAGRIQNTLTGEVDRVARAYINYFGAFQQGVLVLVYMTFAFFVDVKFALLVTLGGGLTNFLYKVIYTRTKGASNKFTRDTNTYQGLIIQHVFNFKYLKATGFLEKFGGKLKESIQQIEQSRKKMGIMAGILESSREPLLIFVVAMVIIIQTTLLSGSLGLILLSLLFFYRALNALMFMQNQWNGFLEVSGSLNNLQDFQNHLEANREKTGKMKTDEFCREFRLENVFFRYNQEFILKNINITIQKNEIVAFAGESGSGKTTLVNILAGLLPVTEGRFFVDNVLSNELNIVSYQKRIGYITQEPAIFNDTVYNNVSLWADPTPENLARFEKAIKEASISNFLDTLPDGSQTILGINGINLSGGQRQRISIARELFKDIDILIMDEATSALDTETEKEIQQSIYQLKGKYTILIVAHRFSTIREADRIVVLKNGEIEAINKFDQLVANNKMFKKMVELQEILNKNS